MTGTVILLKFNGSVGFCMGGSVAIILLRCQAAVGNWPHNGMELGLTDTCVRVAVP